MTEFIVRMRIKYSNVLAFVTAETPAMARFKAEKAEWHDLEQDTAEMVDWEVLSVEKNE